MNFATQGNQLKNVKLLFLNIQTIPIQEAYEYIIVDGYLLTTA